jgi:NTP pyrophosphatase (non-canonical NTP hydrolase)
MKVNEYQELAMRTVNPDLDKNRMLINSVMGLCGESGEAIDIAKKWYAHGHEFDKEHFAKELGDICWYLAEAATAIGVDLESIMAANIEKLRKRYPEGFSTEDSINRVDVEK